MNPLTAFIKRHPQETFWGISWFAFFLCFFLYLMFPNDLWLFMLWGPFLTGALVTAIVDGRQGLKTYFGRIVRWRVGLQWYAVALLLPLLIRLAAYGLNLVSGAAAPVNFQLPSWPDLVFAAFIGLLFNGLGEEPGFRGFALPRLMVRRSALAASLILGVLHAIWHLPLFISGSDSPMIIPIIISGAIINTWIFNKTNGSVLMNILMHASVAMWVDVFNPLFAGSDAVRHLVWLIVVYAALAVLLPILTGPNLGRKPEQTVEILPGEQPVVAK